MYEASLTLIIHSRQVGKISFDDRSGDFLEYSGPLEINLRTLFHFRKPLPPRLDPCSFKRPIPPQPIPLSASSMVGAWIWGGAPLTGSQLDAIGDNRADESTTAVAGPKRPPMPKEPGPKKPIISWGKVPEDAPKSTAPAMPKRTAVAKQRGPTRDARERQDVYVTTLPV
jgi:syntaxin-binding protein 5